ncbi:hypothetical protein D3C87_1044470 [compost metagenome]
MARQAGQHGQGGVRAADLPDRDGRRGIARGQPRVALDQLVGEVVGGIDDVIGMAIGLCFGGAPLGAGLEAGGHHQPVANGGGGPQRAAGGQHVSAIGRQRGCGQHAAEGAQARHLLGQPRAAVVPPRERAERAVERGEGQVGQLLRMGAGGEGEEHGIAAVLAAAPPGGLDDLCPMPARHARWRAAAEAGSAGIDRFADLGAPPCHQGGGEPLVVPAQPHAGQVAVRGVRAAGGAGLVHPAIVHGRRLSGKAVQGEIEQGKQPM